MQKRLCIVGGEDVHKRIPLSKYLIDAGYSVTILGTSTSEFPEYINYVSYNLKRPFSPTSDYKTIRWLRAFFKTQTFDIIHTFDTKPAFLTPYALLSDSTPITRTVTGLGTIFMSKNISNFLLRRLYMLIHLRIKKRVSRTIFQNSDDQKYYLDKHLATENSSELIYSSGIELKNITQQAPRNNTSFTFICIARLVYEKGIVNFLEAARICHKKGFDFKFFLVGPLEEDSNRLNEELVKSYDDIIDRLGERTDVLDLLLASDALVLPTFREGFARVLLEAASVGLPMISTNVTGVREFARHNEEALLIEPKDSNALASAMIELASNSDLANRLSENALNRVKLFSLENVSKQYITIFDTVIKSTH